MSKESFNMRAYVNLPEKTKPSCNKRKSAKLYEEEKRARTFVPSWSKEFEWLEYDSEGGQMFCRGCKLYDQNGPFVTGCTNFRKDTLKGHEKSVSHKLNMEREAAASAPTSSSVASSSLVKLKSHVASRVKMMFRTVHGMALKGRPFTDFVWLCHLDRSKGLDIGTDYVNDKQAALFTSCVAAAEMERIKAEITKADFLSIITDGSTDKSHQVLLLAIKFIEVANIVIIIFLTFKSIVIIDN